MSPATRAGSEAVSDETVMVRMEVWAGWHQLIGFLGASTPLAGLGVILFRMGWRRLWPFAPLLLAAALGVAMFVSLEGLEGLSGRSPRLILATALGCWSSGAFASTFVTILWLAAFGFRRGDAVSERAAGGSS